MDIEPKSRSTSLSGFLFLLLSYFFSLTFYLEIFHCGYCDNTNPIMITCVKCFKHMCVATDDHGGCISKEVIDTIDHPFICSNCCVYLSIPYMVFFTQNSTSLFSFQLSSLTRLIQLITSSSSEQVVYITVVIGLLSPCGSIPKMILIIFAVPFSIVL